MHRSLLVSVVAVLALLTACGPVAVAPELPSAPAAPTSEPSVRTTAQPAPVPQPPSPLATPATGCAAPTVCTTTDSAATLNITKPGVYDGQRHKVPSIRITASGVTVRNFFVAGGSQTGVVSEGNGNVIADNDISQISYGTDDLDGIRFFGNATQILRNNIHNLIKGPAYDAHPDCIQTFATPSKNGSASVTIDSNQCMSVPNPTAANDVHQCITAEGPKSTDGGGGGAGISASWFIRNNRCQGTSNQAVVLRDIHVVQVTGNTFDGHDAKAVQLADGTSQVSFSGNVLGKNVRALSGD